MSDLVSRIAETAGLPLGVAGVLLGLAAALGLGSTVRLIGLARPGVSSTVRAKRLGSLAVWWSLFALLVLVALLGKRAAILAFALISLAGLHEFRRLARERIAPVRLWWRLTYFAIPVHYFIILQGWNEAVTTFIPIGVYCTLLVRLAIGGRIRGFLETAGITFLGLMLVVFLFSHAVRLLVPPIADSRGFGLLLFLLVLTEGNDIAQALWGRLLGRHPITPTVSPNKTWEGFLLGAATTTTAALLLAGPLTSFSRAVALTAGLLIAIGGFLGDLIMSAVKREVGVKDSGTLLPGQGGVLDRLDSLTFTGPLFYYFVRLIGDQQ